MRSVTTLTRLARLNAIVHVIGLGLAATVMKRAYLDHAPHAAGLAWQLAWGWWIVAGAVLVTLMVALARRERTRLANIAVIFASAALATDVVADGVWISSYPTDPEWHRLWYLMGAVIANALYSAAVLFMGYRHKTLSLVVFSCGVLFSISAAFGWRLPTMAFSGATILLYSYWGLVMARPVPAQ